MFIQLWIATVLELFVSFLLFFCIKSFVNLSLLSVKKDKGKTEKEASPRNS